MSKIASQLDSDGKVAVPYNTLASLCEHAPRHTTANLAMSADDGLDDLESFGDDIGDALRRAIQQHRKPTRRRLGTKSARDVLLAVGRLVMRSMGVVLFVSRTSNIGGSSQPEPMPSPAKF